MKKRILAALFALTLIALSLVTLTACDNDTALVYGKKYIIEDDVKKDTAEQTYFVFEKNGTCKKHYYEESTRAVSYDPDTDKTITETITINYIVQYRYTFADDSTIIYFYNDVIDSSTYTDSDGKTVSFKDSEDYDDYYLPETNSSGLIMVSKNVLCIAGIGYTFYINEDYLDTIPNFNQTNETDKAEN